MFQFEKVFSVLHRADALGEKQLSNGTLLIGAVPHVAPQAWLHQIFAFLEDSDIQKIEQEIRRRLPSDFRAFLKIANGINIFSGALFLYGLRRNYVRIGDEARQPFSIVTINTVGRPKDALKSYVFIGGYGWDGSHLYTDEETGKIFRSARGTAKPLNEWKSFEEMLVEETIRLASLFDEKGSKLDPKMSTIPQ